MAWITGTLIWLYVFVENVWICRNKTPKMLVSACRKLWYLSASKKKIYNSLLSWDVTF